MNEFQLTASQGGWHIWICYLHIFRIVSTHSLARRLTGEFNNFCYFWDVSTHSLARRLTSTQKPVRKFILCFNSQPRKEADDFQHYFCENSIGFNSQPRKEADSNFEQKYLLRNCIFYNYCIYYFLYLSCIQLFTHFFSINSPIFRCECPRKSCVLSFRTIISRYL